MTSPTGSRFRLPGTRPLVRDPDETHRVGTPLELLFDLCFVVGLAQAAAAYHHEMVEGHAGDGTAGFALGFFAVWWGWMNFTWFASGHDADDVVHRLLTLVQMAGALLLAAGIARAVTDGDYTVVVAGFVVMRVGLLGSWLRVARHVTGPNRRRALRYFGGVAALQVLWVAWLWVPARLGLVVAMVLAIAEMAVPVWAERAAGRATFHPTHIEERYGAFTIIVLGESILSATVGFQGALDARGISVGLAVMGVSALVLAFGAWWLYFDHPGHLAPRPDQAFRWGYGHVVIFAALASLGAGVYVAVEAGAGHGSERVGALAVAVPVAGFLLGLVLVMLLAGTPVASPRVWSKLVGAAAVVVLGLGAPLTWAVALTAAVVVVLVVAMVLHDDEGESRGGPVPAATRF